jgi:hypothetical protein
MKQVQFQEGEHSWLPKISSTMTLKPRMVCFQKEENDEIMHMFVASGVYIQMSPWPPPFMMMGRQGCATALKITMSWGWLECKKERMMRTCHSWIQPHPHGVILRHLWNTVNLFLCSSTNYFDNRLLPNDLIIVRNHGDGEEEEHDIKRVLERQGDVHFEVEIQSNLEFHCLIASPTQSPGPPHLLIDVQDAYEIRFWGSTYEWKEDEINFSMELVPGTTKVWVDLTWQNNFHI